MRIFVLGVGAAGSLLAKFLQRQGHRISCGDRDPDRAHHFLGANSEIPVSKVNARDMWGILRAAHGCQLVVNTCPPVLNRIIMRAALRLRAHYFDTASHYTAHPFRAEQTDFPKDSKRNAGRRSLRPASLQA
jgi:saccharopine dehydrogenase-like NADP-dependent oxidoreductase